MNNKIFAGFAVFLLLLIIGTMILFTMDAYYKTIYSEKVTFQSILDNDSLKAKLGLGNINNPEALGLSYKTVDFNSFDGTPLQAWYISSSETSNKCIILSHDHRSNRLETLKYLKAFKKAGLHKKFNLFALDLRNAGASGNAANFMGYHAAEDIATSITLLKERFDVEVFVLFGTGLGATTSAIAARRNDLQLHYRSLDVEISGLILDSPISNVGKELTKKHAKITSPLASVVCYYFNNQINGYLPYMRLNALLSKTDYDVLIFQNIGDEQTSTPSLLEEIRDLPSIKLEIFDGDEHANIIQHPRYRARYMNKITSFLRDAE